MLCVLLQVLLGVAPPLVVAGLLWVTASPASPLRRAASATQPQPLAYPCLLDTSGNPLRDAKGRRLCLMQAPSDAPGAAQQQLVTDTGDMVCVHVEAAAPEQMLVVKSLKCRKGGARKNLLLDDHGRRLLGKDSQLLQVRRFRQAGIACFWMMLYLCTGIILYVHAVLCVGMCM
jgi:hypothetical protein